MHWNSGRFYEMGDILVIILSMDKLIRNYIIKNTEPTISDLLNMIS